MIRLIVPQLFEVLAHLPMLIHDLHFLLLLLPFESLDAALSVRLAQHLSLLTHDSRVIPVRRILQSQLLGGAVLALETGRELFEIAHVGPQVDGNRFHFLLEAAAHVIDISLLCLSQFQDLLLSILHLSHEGAYAAVVALLSIL